MGGAGDSSVGSVWRSTEWANPAQTAGKRNPVTLKTLKLKAPTVYAGKREIKALHVKCDNRFPCGWEGTLGTLDQHISACQRVPCPKRCTDPSMNRVSLIPRKAMKEHLATECPNRDHRCPHCGEKGTYLGITEGHDGVCERKPVPCRNPLCGQVMERGRLEHHLERECGFTVVSCKFEGIGCAVKLKRQDVIEHEETDDRSHLHLALDCILELRKAVSSVLEERSVVLREGGSMVLKVTDFHGRKERSEVFKSPSFYTGPNGYHMVVQVHPNGCGYGRGTHVSVYMRILEGRNDGELRWPFPGTLSVKLLNQLEDANHHVKEVKPAIQAFDVETGTSRGCAKFVAHSKLGSDPVHNTQYLMDDSLHLRVSVEVVGRRSWLE